MGMDPRTAQAEMKDVGRWDERPIAVITMEDEIGVRATAIQFQLAPDFGKVCATVAAEAIRKHYERKPDDGEGKAGRAVEIPRKGVHKA